MRWRWRSMSSTLTDTVSPIERISLGLKQTQEDPWQRVVDTYNINDELEGTVTKVVTFGAFVEILDGVEGLVHISELAQHHVENPREIIQPGDPVRVKILEIDSERRRLSLSIKRVEGQVLPVRPIVPPAEGDTDLDDMPELGLSEDVFSSVPDAPAPAIDSPDPAPAIDSTDSSTGAPEGELEAEGGSALVDGSEESVPELASEDELVSETAVAEPEPEAVVEPEPEAVVEPEPEAAVADETPADEDSAQGDEEPAEQPSA